MTCTQLQWHCFWWGFINQTRALWQFIRPSIVTGFVSNNGIGRLPSHDLFSKFWYNVRSPLKLTGFICNAGVCFFKLTQFRHCGIDRIVFSISDSCRVFVLLSTAGVPCVRCLYNRIHQLWASACNLCEYGTSRPLWVERDVHSIVVSVCVSALPHTQAHATMALRQVMYALNCAYTT